jgi:hypothetical protein
MCEDREHLERPCAGANYVKSSNAAATPDPQKVNWCDAAGNCTCPDQVDGNSCRYFDNKKFLDCGLGCIFYAWSGQCMSPEAREAAKELK